MGIPPDENLPEVVPDHSPQALTSREAQSHGDHFDRDDKYPVDLDDAPKYVNAESEHDFRTLAMSPGMESIPWELSSTVNDSHMADRAMTVDERPSPKMVCGLRQRVFWLLLSAVFIIVAGSVGGGVGGGIAAANSRNSPAGTSPTVSSSTPASAAVSTSTSASTTFDNSAAPSPSPSSTVAPDPIYLNNQTSPTRGFAFQGFEGRNYTVNATQIYREGGFHDLPFPCISYVWLPNNTNCCITFCPYADNDGGWWCEEKRQTNASGPFERVWIGCGDNVHKQHACP